MRLILTVVLSAVLILSLTSCGNNAEIQALKNENEELRQRLDEHSNTNGSLGELSISNLEYMKQINIGEIVSVQTEFGDFEIQIDNIHKTNIYDKSPDVFAATIQCVVNNISYSSKLYPNTINGYDIAENNSYIQLTDNNGIAFPFYSISGPTDGGYAISHKLHIGNKSRESYPFLVPAGTTDVSVIINNQYILNTTIDE